MDTLSDFYLLVIAAQRRFSSLTFENQVYQIIDRDLRFAGWSDERRADLYSLLVESITSEDRIGDVELKVAEAWKKNSGRFHG
jgi:hypothetical protein